MSQYPVPGNPPAAVAPPTFAGPLSRPSTPPAWPKVIGIISIVFGVGGVLGGLWGFVSPFMLNAFANFVPAGQPNPFDAMRVWAIPLAAANALSALVAGLLLVGGIALMQERPWSARALLSWAALKMLVSVATIGIAVAMQVAQLNGMMAQSSSNASSPTLPSGLPMLMGVFMAVFGLLWAWALPVFMLIWFTRKGVRAHIARWRTA